MRDVYKVITDTADRIPAAYDMRAGDIRAIMGEPDGMTKEDRKRLYDAVCNAFVFGYAMGARATIKNMEGARK